MFSYRHFERSEKSFLQSDKRRTSPHSPALFHTASALSAPSGLGIREYHDLKWQRSCH